MKKILLFMLVLVMALGSISVGANNPNLEPTPKPDINDSDVVNYWKNGIGFDFNLDSNNNGVDDWVDISYDNDFYFSKTENKNEYINIYWIYDNKDATGAVTEKEDVFNQKYGTPAGIANVISSNTGTAVDSIKVDNVNLAPAASYTSNSSNEQWDKWNLTYTANADGAKWNSHSVFYCKATDNVYYCIEYTTNKTIGDAEQTIKAIVDSVHISKFADVRDVDIINKNGDVIPPKHWASDVIAKWSERGILKGYEDGSFRPDKENNIINGEKFNGDIKINEFSAVINRIFGWIPEGTVYDDKSKENLSEEEKAIIEIWSLAPVVSAIHNELLTISDLGLTYDDIAKCAPNNNNSISPALNELLRQTIGITFDEIKGILDNTSIPGIPAGVDIPITTDLIQTILGAADNPISRQIAFKMLAKALELQPDEKINEADKRIFIDIGEDDIDQDNKGFVYAMINNKYVNGEEVSKEENSFKISPKDPLSRAEAMKIVDNTIAHYVNNLENIKQGNTYKLDVEKDIITEAKDNSPDRKFIVFKNGISEGTVTDVEIANMDSNKYTILPKDGNIKINYGKADFSIKSECGKDVRIVLNCAIDGIEVIKATKAGFGAENPETANITNNMLNMDLLYGNLIPWIVKYQKLDNNNIDLENVIKNITYQVKAENGEWDDSQSNKFTAEASGNEITIKLVEN